MNEKVAPVSEGEEYKVNINAVGEKGDGIAKVKGFVLFVPKTKKGDYVKIKITKVLKNVAFAEVVEKLQRPPSKFVTVSRDQPEEEEVSKDYEDTEDFGEEDKE